ncbi:MAG TPA: isopentenyl phosphate kinase family protein [Desulfurococcales archaeon]|nr:isopentenyl phosphate kinase family protein [Desulfurococcales archaeon]
MNVIVLKLGGSVITDKNVENSIKWGVLKRIGNEIKSALQHLSGNTKLIIVHGGGSFGHPLASKFKRIKGYYDSEAFIAIRENMNTLASIISLLLSCLGLKASHFQSSSLFILNKGRIVKAFLDPITYSLENDIIPILYGDIAVDLSRGYDILSGDSIVAYLANYYNAIKILYATDVDGVYTDNPKVNPLAKRIERIIIVKSSIDGKYTISTRVKGDIIPHMDVTGGIYRKILDLAQYARRDLIAYIFNGLIEGNIFRAIINKPEECTVVEVKMR